MWAKGWVGGRAAGGGHERDTEHQVTTACDTLEQQALAVQLAIPSHRCWLWRLLCVRLPPPPAPHRRSSFRCPCDRPQRLRSLRSLHPCPFVPPPPFLPPPPPRLSDAPGVTVELCLRFKRPCCCLVSPLLDRPRPLEPHAQVLLLVSLCRESERLALDLLGLAHHAALVVVVPAAALAGPAAFPQVGGRCATRAATSASSGAVLAAEQTGGRRGGGECRGARPDRSCRASSRSRSRSSSWLVHVAGVACHGQPRQRGYGLLLLLLQCLGRALLLPCVLCARVYVQSWEVEVVNSGSWCSAVGGASACRCIC